ncbi:long-chain fatty acid--CoA ligase [soil metagenome]
MTPLVDASTLSRRAEAALERLGDHPSLLFEGSWLTSGQLAARARRAAAGFVGLGVEPGDRVLLIMANCPEVGITYAALWRAGAVATPVLFLLSEDELRHVLSDSGAVAIVTTPEFLPKVLAVADGRPVVVVGGEGGTTTFAELESGDELSVVDRTPQDLAALLYTGGTTGRSKGVALTHAGLDAAGAAGYAAGHRPGRTVGLLPLPLAHVYGLMVSVTGLHAVEPSRSVLMRWFDPAGFVSLVQEHRVQSSALVPSMLQMLLSQPLEDHDLSSLERVSSGGAPLAVEVARERERRIPGLEVREGYGCTETTALIAAQPEERRLGSVGKPVGGIAVRITDPDGQELPAGQDGEICVQGPLVMSGYWRSPEATAQAVQDGWFHTGDVGHLDDDGYLYVVDRIKDLIIRNGFNVYPRDVEDVLLAHCEVTAAAVVGRPDPQVGEEVVAFVSVAPGSTLTPDRLVAHAKQHISAAKYPREVRIVDSIPLTSVLKTDRKALRAQAR